MWILGSRGITTKLSDCLEASSCIHTAIMEEEDILPDCSSCIVLIYTGVFTPLILLYGILEPGCLRQQPIWTWRSEQQPRRIFEVDRDFPNATQFAESTNFRGSAKNLLPRCLSSLLSRVVDVDVPLERAGRD